MSTPGVTIAPLATAVARMHQKTPVAKQLTSAEWSDVPLALRERAFWTARFTLADTLQAMHDHIGKRLDLTRVTTDRGNVYANRDNFIVEMRKHLEMQGYVPPPGKAGTLQDHSTTGRLGMIFDINTQQAQEFARFKAETPDTLDAFPAQELFRAESRKEPRAWHARWTQAGGHLTQGRMIALKDSPVWQAISAFGTPWPPFDYQSGMDLRDISRPEAQRLGLIEPGQLVERPDVGFNDELKKSVERYEPGIVEQLLGDFGGRVRVEGGVAALIPEPVRLMPAPPEMSVAEARAAIEQGFQVADADGVEAKFGQRILRYFAKAGGEKDDRLKALLWAKQAVRTGTKSVLEDRIVFTQAFETEGKPKGVITLVSLPDGEVWNFYRKPAGKLMSTKPDGSTRSALEKVESLPTPSPADGNVKPTPPEVKP